MKQENRMQLSRRAFLHALGMASGVTLLAACAPAPSTAPAASNEAAPASEEQVVNFLWTDATNTHQPLIQDFETARGIKVNQTQVQYNQLLDKITTSIQGGADVDVIEMDTIWTAQFASAGWVDDISDRITGFSAQRRDLQRQIVWYALVQ